MSEGDLGSAPTQAPQGEGIVNLRSEDLDLFIDSFDGEEVSLSFTKWNVQYAIWGLAEVVVDAAPYDGDLGPPGYVPCDLTITLPSGEAWHGGFFFDDRGESLHLVSAANLSHTPPPGKRLTRYPTIHHL